MHVSCMFYVDFQLEVHEKQGFFLNKKLKLTGNRMGKGGPHPCYCHRNKEGNPIKLIFSLRNNW